MRKIDVCAILILIIVAVTITLFLLIAGGPEIMPFALGFGALFIVFIIASIFSGHYRTSETPR
ncbi:MAG: hypothetical protein ACFFDP_12275 [Promethearchaeota archaeon]